MLLVFRWICHSSRNIKFTATSLVFCVRKFAMTVPRCSRLLAAIASPALTAYTRQTLLSLRQTPRGAQPGFIDCVGDCGLLRYRGSRGGRLTLEYSERIYAELGGHNTRWLLQPT